MTQPSAKVIADSITAMGHRLTTLEATCWRPVLAEQNTHRILSRNSASSRAIPIKKNLERFDTDFAYPLAWGSEKPGMQQGGELEDQDLWDAKKLWNDCRWSISKLVHEYVDSHPIGDDAPEGSVRLHKGLLNRWLEPGLWQTQIITGTTWDGYFWQRCHEHADANIRAMAEAIQTAVAESEPKFLVPGEYHTPYFADQGGFEDDWDEVAKMKYNQDNRWWQDTAPEVVEMAKRVSAGRCARVSAMNQSGRRDIKDDLVLYTRLADRSDDPTNPPHASPLEHIATPWIENEHTVIMPNGKKMGPLPRLGNFIGWWQMRHEELAF